MKKFLILTIALVACLLVTGCDGLSIFGNNSKSDSGDVSAEPRPFPVVIDGITIESSPERIISLSPSLTEIVFELGEGERIIGRSDYCDYPRNTLDIEIVQSGIAFDIEEIIQHSADLLLLSSPIPERDRLVLEREGTATLVIPAPKSLHEFLGVYRMLGLALNGGFVGLETGESAFSNVALVCKNPDDFDLGNFVYVTENMLIATGDTFESAILSCFGNNLAEDANGYTFSKKELIDNQPDLILLSNVHNIEDLLQDNIFGELDAVQNKRVIVVDNTYFERPSARIITLISDIRAGFNDLR